MTANTVQKRPSTAYSAENVDYVASSEMGQETMSFIWSLKRFSTLHRDEVITSPPFRGGPKNNYDWIAVAEKKMHPPTISQALTRYLCINLKCTSRSKNTPSTPTMKSTVKAGYQFSLLDPDDRAVWQSVLTVPPLLDEFEEGKIRAGPLGCFIIGLDNASVPWKSVIVDDTMRIHCRIWTKSELQSDIVINPKRRKIDRPTLMVSENLFNRTNELKRDLKSGLENSELTDVSLVTPTKTLKAHKFLLSARSPVFQAMFRSPMVESTENVVNISDFSAEVVEGMLEYMYTGECPNLIKDAWSLLQIADKYQLIGLKTDCEEQLKCHLTCENAAEVLSLAHQVNCTGLKSHILQYINKNKESVRKTTGFMELVQTDAELLMELFMHQ